MKAVVFAGKGGPEVVEWQDVPDPQPQRGEVLLKVRASAMNRADLLQRRGLYPPPPGWREDIPGLELAGEVADLGPGVAAWRRGDRVMAIASGEAHAQLAIAHERMLVRVPDALSWEEAGAIMEAGLTAHDAMFTLGALRPGWPVLVHAAGSGVSTVAIQIAKAAGAMVIGTSRTAEKLERARALGLDHGVVVAKEDPRFSAEVKTLTGGRGVPLVLDFVGGPYLAENMASLATGGRLVVIGTMGGPKAQVDLSRLMFTRATIVGTTLRMRPLEEKIAATVSFARDVLPLLASGRVRAIVDASIPMERAREAHDRMERNDTFGKLVLVPS